MSIISKELQKKVLKYLLTTGKHCANIETTVNIWFMYYLTTSV